MDPPHRAHDARRRRGLLGPARLGSGRPDPDDIEDRHAHPSARLPVGAVTVTGVACAQHRSISQVELRADAHRQRTRLNPLRGVRAQPVQLVHDIVGAGPPPEEPRDLGRLHGRQADEAPVAHHDVRVRGALAQLEVVDLRPGETPRLDRSVRGDPAVVDLEADDGKTPKEDPGREPDEHLGADRGAEVAPRELEEAQGERDGPRQEPGERRKRRPKNLCGHQTSVGPSSPRAGSGLCTRPSKRSGAIVSFVRTDDAPGGRGRPSEWSVRYRKLSEFQATARLVATQQTATNRCPPS